MTKPNNSALETRLDMLRAAMPKGDPCKGKRGRVRKCLQLLKYRERAEQLYPLARNRSDRNLVDELIVEIERRRAAVADENAYLRSRLAKLRSQLEKSAGEESSFERLVGESQRIVMGLPMRAMLDLEQPSRDSEESG